MKKTNLIIYLIINVIVSAVTTLTVLWLWDRSHPDPELVVMNPAPAATRVESTTPTDEPIPTPQPSPSPTIVFASTPLITIRTIVGAGNLDAEYVEIYNESDGPVDLTGWALKDEDGHQFIFDGYILNSGGAVKIYSKTGQNIVIELYLQADAPIWESGELAVLIDAAENTVSTYTIP